MTVPGDPVPNNKTFYWKSFINKVCKSSLKRSSCETPSPVSIKTIFELVCCDQMRLSFPWVIHTQTHTHIKMANLKDRRRICQLWSRFGISGLVLLNWKGCSVTVILFTEALWYNLTIWSWGWKEAVTHLSDYIIRSLTASLNSNSHCEHFTMRRICAGIFLYTKVVYRETKLSVDQRDVLPKYS